MELTEQQIEYLWDTCDCPDILVQLLDERGGWDDRQRREFCCSAARRALEQNDLPTDLLDVPYNYGWRADITDEMLDDAKYRAELMSGSGNPKINGVNVVYAVWACSKNIRAATHWVAQQSSVDTEMRQMAENALLKRAMKLPSRYSPLRETDHDFAEDALEWVDAQASESSEAQLQCRWLRDHIKFPKVPHD